MYCYGFSCSIIFDAFCKPGQFSQHFLTDKEPCSHHRYTCPHRYIQLDCCNHILSCHDFSSGVIFVF